VPFPKSGHSVHFESRELVLALIIVRSLHCVGGHPDLANRSVMNLQMGVLRLLGCFQLGVQLLLVHEMFAKGVNKGGNYEF
jgi:hypothetical protein